MASFTFGSLGDIISTSLIVKDLVKALGDSRGSAAEFRGSGNILQDASMKVRWQVSHSNELQKFRAEINSHCTSLNMLLISVGV